MIQLAICDDDADELEKTASLIDAYRRQNPDADIVCSMFRSGAELIGCIRTGSLFDIYLLDILMPDMDGIEAGASIRERDDEAAIVYLSASDEYGVKSYRVRAYDYLVKPVKAQSLFSTLDELLRKMADKGISAFPIKTKNGIHTIRPHRLVYVEYQNHKCYYHLDGGDIIESVTLREPFDGIVARIMADRRFVKSAAAYLVNLAYVRSIERRELILKDGKRLPVSRTRITDLRKNFITYLLERGRGE